MNQDHPNGKERTGMTAINLKKIQSSDPLNTVLDLAILAGMSNATARTARRVAERDSDLAPVAEQVNAIHLGTLIAVAVAVNGIERYGDCSDLDAMISDGVLAVNDLARQAGAYSRSLS